MPLASSVLSLQLTLVTGDKKFLIKPSPNPGVYLQFTMCTPHGSPQTRSLDPVLPLAYKRKKDRTQLRNAKENNTHGNRWHSRRPDGIRRWRCGRAWQEPFWKARLVILAPLPPPSHACPTCRLPQALHIPRKYVRTLRWEVPGRLLLGEVGVEGSLRPCRL